MGQIVYAWQNATSQAAEDMFSGSLASIGALDTLITGGKLIAGIPATSGSLSFQDTLSGSVTSAFFAYTIPALWSVAGYDVFVIDSGTSCGSINPITAYMSIADQEASWACYPDTTGGLYYLAMPVTSQFQANCSGSSPSDPCPDVPFTVPPGLSALTGTPGTWGGITRRGLIQG